MPPPQDPFYAGLGQAVRIGTELLAALIVGGGLGYLADWYFETRPVALFVGVFLGMSAGLLSVYRSFSRL